MDIRYRNNDVYNEWFNVSVVFVYNVKLLCKIGFSYFFLKLY